MVLPASVPHVVIGIAAYAAFFFSLQTPLGFRGDYDRMDLLKSLPIGPLAMACGQTLVIPTIVTLLQWAAFAATACVVPAAAVEMLAAGLFALPLNWVLFGTHNFLFLLYPFSLYTTGSEGFLKMGRAMLFMLLTSLVLGACGVAAAIPAAAVYFITDSLPAACLAAWLILLALATGILLLVGWAFQHFDVSAGVAE